MGHFVMTFGLTVALLLVYAIIYYLFFYLLYPHRADAPEPRRRKRSRGIVLFCALVAVISFAVSFVVDDAYMPAFVLAPIAGIGGLLTHRAVRAHRTSRRSDHRM